MHNVTFWTSHKKKKEKEFCAKPGTHKSQPLDDESDALSTDLLRQTIVLTQYNKTNLN